ncbi:MAG: type III pantothenate kinase [Syntrophothermus sp.]
MFLACDLGNTFVKMGVYDGSRLIKFFKKDYNSFQEIQLGGFGINEAAVSSVVPTRTVNVASFVKGQCGIDPYIITRKSLLNIRINYLTPNTLGIDRICSLEGALSLFNEGSPLRKSWENVFIITVDLGTATTINVLKYHDGFTGGIIAPGLKTMARSLNSNTSELPEIDLISDYNGFWGRDTRSSIASGIIHSTICLIERAVKNIETDNHSSEIWIYATGGNSDFIKPHLKLNNLNYVQGLVLYGVKSIYERNRSL